MAEYNTRFAMTTQGCYLGCPEHEQAWRRRRARAIPIYDPTYDFNDRCPMQYYLGPSYQIFFNYRLTVA